jgi:undecaprenyl diphosphate synthase
MNLALAISPQPTPLFASRVRHLAIVPDGNRRWARRRGLSTEAGHYRGFREVAPGLVERAWESGVHTVTLWLLSTENWKRDPAEINYLLRIYDDFLDEMEELAHQHDARLIHLGRSDRLPAYLRETLRRVQASTRDKGERIFNIALDYGGQDEMCRAVARLIQRGADPSEITESMIASALDTANQPHPDPDLVIRTSGESRMSGFMSWQSVYSELSFVPECFPDLTPGRVSELLRDFDQRDRRCGR